MVPIQICPGPHQVCDRCIATLALFLIGGFGNIALVLGAIITVLSAYDAFFDPRALWVRETITFAKLKDLQRDIRFAASGLDPAHADAQHVKELKLRLDRILDDGLKYWMKIRGAPDLTSEPSANQRAKRKAEDRGSEGRTAAHV